MRDDYEIICLARPNSFSNALFCFCRISSLNSSTKIMLIYISLWGKGFLNLILTSHRCPPSMLNLPAIKFVKLYWLILIVFVVQQSLAIFFSNSWFRRHHSSNKYLFFARIVLCYRCTIISPSLCCNSNIGLRVIGNSFVLFVLLS